MLTIGLTGAIGSGKSTVARIFETLSIPVYYADAAAKRLMQENPKIIQNITTVFGRGAYDNGLLNRKFISDIVFYDESKLKELNAIVHPATLADAEVWISNQSSPYIIKEAALLFESGSNQSLDYIIGVQASPELSVQRVMLRDGVSEQDVLLRMKKQMDSREKLSLCDFIIVNDGTRAVKTLSKLTQPFFNSSKAFFNFFHTVGKRNSYTVGITKCRACYS
jgi:dephospho-CoA kinase